MSEKFPGTGTLVLEHRYSNLVICHKYDGCITIQRADIPETVAALLAVAAKEKIDRSEIKKCCRTVGVDFDWFERRSR